MDFILVPDALAASEVRYALAKNNTIGTRVGSFPVLLETLAELWLLELPTQNWDDLLQEKALAMENAFWSKSIQIDEIATLSQIKKSLQFLFNYKPLGSALQPIKAPEDRYSRYVNDLIELAESIGEQPETEQLAVQWFERHTDAAIEPLHIYSQVDISRLYPWQQKILEIFKNKGWLAPQESKYQYITAAKSSNAQSNIHQFTESLFNVEAAKIPQDNLYWLTCRDAMHEAEAVTSMIQAAINEGAVASKIAVVVPANGDYERLLAQYFTPAGLIASNLSQDSSLFDWQSALLNDLLTIVAKPDLPMAVMSVLINPLMPWGAGRGYQLADQYAKKFSFDGINDTNAVEGEQTLRELLLTTPQNTSADVVQWLQSITALCRKTGYKGLTQKRFQNLLDTVERVLVLNEGISLTQAIDRVLQYLPVSTLEVDSERTRYIDGITIITEDEALPITVEQLFVLGFNQGHYCYQPENTGAIPREAWNLIAPKLGLSIPTTEQNQLVWQQDFAQLLSKADTRITFMRSTSNELGELIEASDTLLDMALCFQELSDLNPLQLEQSILKAQHPLLKTEKITLKAPDEIELKDLDFGKSLPEAMKNKDGDIRTESPSSLERLMISPLSWLLNRLYLESKIWEPQAPNILILGNIAHKAFELFFMPSSGEHKETQQPLDTANFDKVFNEAVTSEAPFLNSEQWSVKKNQLHNQVLRALQALLGWCQEHGWKVIQTEQDITGTHWGISLRGSIDAVLSNGEQHLIVDYKTSKHKKRLERLEKGYDLQTLIYRELFEQQNENSQPLSGYYTLNDSTLVSDQDLPSSDDLKVVCPEKTVEEQSEKASELVSQQIEDIYKGLIKLNSSEDSKTWDKQGITAYALKDNTLLTRFMHNGQESE